MSHTHVYLCMFTSCIENNVYLGIKPKLWEYTESIGICNSAIGRLIQTPVLKLSCLKDLQSMNFDKTNNFLKNYLLIAWFWIYGVDKREVERFISSKSFSVQYL